MSKEKTVYERLKEAGCDIDSHQSDLYVENTNISRSIVLVEFRMIPVYFTCQKTGKPMIELPFMFDPFWEDKAEAK